MKIGILLPIVGVFLAMPATAASNGPTLWKNLRYGMTPEEVKNLQPDAVSPLATSRLASGAECQLELSKVAVDTDQYRVCFYFLKGSLVQVAFNGLGDLGKDQLLRVMDGLRRQYGNEQSIEETPMGYQATWSMPDGVILNVFYMTAIKKVLNVNYQYREPGQP